MYNAEKNKYIHRLKNPLLGRARNHKSLCALGQDLHAPGMPLCRALHSVGLIPYKNIVLPV